MPYYELEKFFIFPQNNPILTEEPLYLVLSFYFRIFFMKKFLLFSGLLLLAQNLFCEPVLESQSKVNWLTKDFISEISYDTVKANLQMPSGKKSASNQIKTKMPQLIQQPLLSLFSDSGTTLADLVVNDELTFDQINHFIMGGYKTPDVFAKDLITLNTTNTTNLNNIEKMLVKHRNAYTPEAPIEDVYSRAYSGIIIDARGKLQVHGEYVKSETYPCLFPEIWDEKMNIVLEKNMVKPEVIREKGEIGYHYSDDMNSYSERIGADPLYIKATQVYGRHRCDPVISKEDSLKILSVPENVKLIQDGKVIILLDKENLIYNIATAEKDNSYYVNYGKVKQYIYENKVPEIEVSDSIDGIRFSVDLKFYPDSEELLPSEKARIETIASLLRDILADNSYTVIVEGHTADVGKPVGQLNLSIERTRTVMNALVAEGLEKSLFSYKGYGGTMPVASNDTEAGRAENRRVEITARPKATYIQRDW